MEVEHEEGISLPQYGFYSVQDESNRRYSRTGKHRILAQKYDPVLMKYRYSDETEKSSPYSKTLSDNESPARSDSSGSYQGVYSPQLAQSGGNFKDTSGYSSEEPRRAWIEDKSAGRWISPGVHPSINDPLEENRHFDYGNVVLSQKWQRQDSPHQDAESVPGSDSGPSQQTSDSDNFSHRAPPPPYSVAIRSTKGLAPKSYRDISPHLTKDLQDLQDIDRLLDNLEGSEPAPGLPYNKSDLAKPANEPETDITKPADVSVWAELVHIDDSGDISEENSQDNYEHKFEHTYEYNSESNSKDEKPGSSSSGIIITGHRERRVSSPERHIRFVLEAKRAKRDPEDISSSRQDTEGRGLATHQVTENYSRSGGERAHYYDTETVGLTPLVDEVFRYPSDSGDAAPAYKTSNHTAYGVDNAAYVHDAEEYDHTSIDHHWPRKGPNSSDIVRQRWMDLYGTGQVYDSSQSSTLDSVFTERSWSSEVGRPRAFRQKRRVYPKPRDPVGDLGDGLQTKSGRSIPNKERGRLQRVNGRGYGAFPRGEHSKRRMQEKDLRRSLIKRELELFMQRKTSNHKLPPTSRRFLSHGAGRSSPRSSQDNRKASRAISARPRESQHRMYEAGRPPANNRGHDQFNRARVHPGHKPRTNYDESLQQAVPLRHRAPREKKERPLSYPNDVNRPFSQMISHEDNNVLLNDLNTIKGKNHSSKKMRQNEQQRHLPSSKHPHQPDRTGNRVTHKEVPHQSNADRKPSEKSGPMSPSHLPEPQSRVKNKESHPSGHVHPPRRAPVQKYAKSDVYQQKPPNERQARADSAMASPTIAAIPETPRRTRGPETTPSTRPREHHHTSDKTRSNSENGNNSQTIGAVAVVPELPRNPEAQINNNHQAPNEEQTPSDGRKPFTNWRCFSVMAAIWFFPIGIWALRKSHQVDDRVKAKDIPGARRASRSARNHAIAAFVVLGFIVLILLARLIEITIDPRKTFIQYYKIVPDEVDAV